MKDELQGLERIHSSMRVALESLAEMTQDLAGENMLALIAFGAVATARFDSTQHTARTVLVLNDIDLEMLRDLSVQGPKFGRLRIAAPLVMTPDYIQASQDTFPLELIEIHQCHVAVLGDDYFDDIAIDSAHLRLQCERELKAMMIGMRQGLLGAGGSEKLIGALNVDVAEGLIRTMRGILWLNDRKQGLPGADVITEVERFLAKPLSGIAHSIDPGKSHGWDEFRTLYNDLEALLEVVDAW